MKSKTLTNQENRESAIVAAVETLSEIADLDFDGEMGISHDNQIVLLNRSVNYQTAHWISGHDHQITMKALKHTFRVVLEYLRQFYKGRRPEGSEKRSYEGIKNIMVLVGEAAAKLDKLAGLLDVKGSVTNLAEFQKLKNFYQSKVSLKEGGDQGLWDRVFSPAAQQTAEKKAGVKDEYSKAFRDLEVVKKDLEYELFFLRKPNGRRFYNPRLMRNMKVVSEFSRNFGTKAAEDPLSGIAVWQDHAYQITAANIIARVHPAMDAYFGEAMKFKERESVGLLNKACMALFLCANSRNLMKNSPAKTSTAYFGDFLTYLRQLLSSEGYEKLASRPGRKDKIESHVVDLTQAICKSLMTGGQGHYAYNPIVQLLVLQGLHELNLEIIDSESIGSRLLKTYDALKQVLKRHPNGPLLQNLLLLENVKTQNFDAMLQGNMPHQLFNIFAGEEKAGHIRLPSPTTQDQIDKASVMQEFNQMLQIGKGNEDASRQLLINLQDRTNWRQHARSAALEGLADGPDSTGTLAVMTLNKDIDFYHQRDIYTEMNDAAVFLQQFAEHLRSENAGYFFSKALKPIIAEGYLEKLFQAILDLFFDGKNVLKRQDRLNFIEIAYCLMEMKAIDLIKPENFSLTCKDCVDLGPIASCELFALIHLLNYQPLLESEKAFFNLMLFAPALIFRQRMPQKTAFERMADMAACVESATKGQSKEVFQKRLKEFFGPLFESSIFISDVALPKPLQSY